MCLIDPETCVASIPRAVKFTLFISVLVSDQNFKTSYQRQSPKHSNSLKDFLFFPEVLDVWLKNKIKKFRKKWFFLNFLI